MKKIDKNNAIRACNILVAKAEQISELRSIPSRQKMLEIFNYLREIFRGREIGEKFTDQQGLGLKILTPTQMFSRLPIALAHLKAGNNSERLNEIMQLLYSLYGSKKLTKQFYKSLDDII